MSIDILIIIIMLLVAFIGYRKGFIVSIINFIVIVGYFYFSDNIVAFLIENFNNIDFFKDLENNDIYRYLFIGVLGIIVFTITSLIIRKIIRKSFLSFFDKIGGLIISLFIAYLLVCLLSTSVNYLSLYMEVSDLFNESFFISEQFNDYNLLYRWWLNE